MYPLTVRIASSHQFLLCMVYGKSRLKSIVYKECKGHSSTRPVYIFGLRRKLRFLISYNYINSWFSIIRNIADLDNLFLLCDVMFSDSQVEKYKRLLEVLPYKTLQWLRRNTKTDIIMFII